MTYPSSRSVSRRAFLVAGGATAAAFAGGCGTVDDLLDDSPEPSSQEPAPSDDDRLIESAVADQRRVLDECRAARSAHKELRTLLNPIVDHHRAHVEILGGSSSQSARANVPSDRVRTLRRLHDVEQKVSDRRANDAAKARAGEFARVLAGISASGAQHVHLIEQAIEENA